MATKKPRSKPTKAVASVRASASKKAARKAAVASIKTDPKIEGVKRAIHEALGRDLADLLSAVGPGGAAGVHAFLPVETTVNSMKTANEPTALSPIKPVQAAMCELWTAIDELCAIGEMETAALGEALGQATPPAILASALEAKRPGSSDLASRIARAAETIAENNRMRRDRLSRIEL